MLYQHSRNCVGTAEYYRSNLEAVLVYQSTICAFGMPCWYSRVLQEHKSGSVGTEKYYRSYRKAVLVL